MTMRMSLMTTTSIIMVLMMPAPQLMNVMLVLMNMPNGDDDTINRNMTYDNTYRKHGESVDRDERELLK
jgi:hypothetical protein